jgi:transposase-like protein
MARRTFKDRDALIAKAVEYYSEGRSTQSIANTLHISQVTVYKMLVSVGTVMRSRGRPVTV